MAILWLLKVRSMTGRDLVVGSDGALKTGTVYIHLQILETARLITSIWKPEDAGKEYRRRIYTITPLGSKLLSEAIADDLMWKGKPSYRPSWPTLIRVILLIAAFVLFCFLSSMERW